MRNLVNAFAALTLVTASAPAVAGWNRLSLSRSWLRAGAGGASDQMARMMQAAIQKNNLMKQAEWWCR